MSDDDLPLWSLFSQYLPALDANVNANTANADLVHSSQMLSDDGGDAMSTSTAAHLFDPMRKEDFSTWSDSDSTKSSSFSPQQNPFQPSPIAQAVRAPPTSSLPPTRTVAAAAVAAAAVAAAASATVATSAFSDRDSAAAAIPALRYVAHPEGPDDSGSSIIHVRKKTSAWFVSSHEKCGFRRRAACIMP